MVPTTGRLRSQWMLLRREDVQRLFEAGCALMYQARVLGGPEYGRALAGTLAVAAAELGVAFEREPVEVGPELVSASSVPAVYGRTGGEE